MIKYLYHSLWIYIAQLNIHSPEIACLKRVDIQLVLMSNAKSLINIGDSPGRSSNDKDPTQFLEYNMYLNIRKNNNSKTKKKST